MKESDLYKHLRRNCKGGHFTRIENSVGVGAPDVHLTIDDHRHWIELKRLMGRQIEVQATELVWASKELKAGADTLYMWYDEGYYCVMLYSTLRNLKPVSIKPSVLRFHAKNQENFRVNPSLFREKLLSFTCT